MDCSFARQQLALYFDGELDRAASREFEAHLDGCAGCRAALVELDELRHALRNDLPRYVAPRGLREHIEARAAPPRRAPSRRYQFALAASLALAFLAGGAVSMLRHDAGDAAGQQMTRDLFASHWRALAATSPVDVISTDRHTVKPWFAGKVAQAPLVQDFADQGFALAGGRIDYVGDERVPVLVYRHGQHLIDVFVLAGARAAAFDASQQREGYALETTRLGGQRVAIVSDMDATELARFTGLIAAAK